MTPDTLAAYPTEPEALRRHIDTLLAEATPDDDVADGLLIGLVAPDSNVASNGPAAAAAFRQIQDAGIECVVVVSPSHHGAFGRLSIPPASSFSTPLGEVPVSDHLRNELCDEDDDIYIDQDGHDTIGGADVQVPFLQRALDGFEVVPVVMGEESPAFCRELGNAVGEVMYGHRALVLGSCELLGGDTEALDRLRDAIERFDESELMYLMGSETVRMTGMGALISTLLASRARGATHARILALTPPDGDAPGALACAFWRA